MELIKASDMIDDIEKEVEHQIKESTWMDTKTKHSILDKLVYLKKTIGYPKSYRNDTIMNEQYKGVSFYLSSKWRNYARVRVVLIPQESI